MADIDVACDVMDCPRYNSYAGVCRLAQFPETDFRFNTPNRCSHRLFKLKERETKEGSKNG